jgi:carboxypeptidase C (cathepsin A)
MQAAEMFYFFFESRNEPDNDPVVIWMQGVYFPPALSVFLRALLHACSPRQRR